MKEPARTPSSVVMRDGSASLLRFFMASPARGSDAPGATAPVLLVPSLINRWYVLDLREGASLTRALLDAGHDVFCLDWGAAEDEDRYLEWSDVIARLARAVLRVRRVTGQPRVALLGYCMGATLAGIYAALCPASVASLVNLAGPFDFAHAGRLGAMVDARWFDARAVAEGGNIAAAQMQSGFVALRPTAQISKWVGLVDRMHDDADVEAFRALEAWASDNVAFPAAAYVTYIEELYQRNLLVQGEHRVAGRRVDLGAIDCPVLTLTADRDTICPPRAARALNDLAGRSAEGGVHARSAVLTVPGGHVGAVVGKRARTAVYPAISRWLMGESVAYALDFE